MRCQIWSLDGVYLREKASKDITLTALYKVIVHGWPEDTSVSSEYLRPYWMYRDELSVQNGIIYKGTQVMVPRSTHKEMLRKIHANHFGAELNIRKAREVLFCQGWESPYKTCVMHVAPMPIWYNSTMNRRDLSRYLQGPGRYSVKISASSTTEAT